MKRKIPPVETRGTVTAEAAPEAPAEPHSAEQSPPAASPSPAPSREVLPPLARGLILCGVFFVTLLACLYLFDRLDLNRSESLIRQWHGKTLSVN